MRNCLDGRLALLARSQHLGSVHRMHANPQRKRPSLPTFSSCFGGLPDDGEFIEAAPEGQPGGFAVCFAAEDAAQRGALTIEVADRGVGGQLWPHALQPAQPVGRHDFARGSLRAMARSCRSRTATTAIRPTIVSQRLLVSYGRTSTRQPVLSAL